MKRGLRSGRRVTVVLVIVMLSLALASCSRAPAAPAPATTAPRAEQAATPAPAVTAPPPTAVPPTSTTAPTAAPSNTPAAVTASAGTTAPSAPPADGDSPGVYEDPSGRFTVPVPAGWRVETGESFVLFRDPDESIKIYVVVVPGNDAGQAIADAWKIGDPSFSLAPTETAEQPSKPGIDQTVAISFDAGDQRMVESMGQRIGDEVYVILLDASMQGLQSRGQEAGAILNGLAIQGLQQLDLAGVDPKSLTPELLAELETYITDAMAQAKVPGASVAIVQGDEVAYLKGFGVRELGKADPVTPDTLMMIGSTGKTMTTMMMATVVDDGRMKWDTPAVEILPEFAVADPEITPKVTMRNLVCNCSGIPRRDLPYIFNAGSFTAEDVVASLRDIDFLTPFGEAFQYSNQMVATGGYLAAQAGSDGADDLLGAYLEQMQKRVLDPIGMSNTTFDFTKVAAAPDYALPHGVTMLNEFRPTPLSDEQILAPVTPAGGAWSTARDMARYLVTELNEGASPDGVRVVSAENLKVTWQPQVAIAQASNAMDPRSSYGLGWMVGDYKGQPMLYHYGNTGGFSADLAVLPEADLGIVVLSNARYVTDFTHAIVYRLFELAFGLPAEKDALFKSWVQAAAASAQELSGLLKPSVDPAHVAPFLGIYTNEELGEVTLSMEGDRLMFDIGEFKTELRSGEPEPGMIMYVGFEGPLAGTSFDLKQGGGSDTRPTIVLSRRAETYTFVKKTG